MNDGKNEVVRIIHVNRIGVRDGEIDLEIVMTPVEVEAANLQDLDVSLHVTIQRGTPRMVDFRIIPNQVSRTIATLALNDDFDYTKPAKVTVIVLLGTRMNGSIEQMV